MSQAYQQAGVNIRAGDEAVERITIHARSTHRPEVIG
ncbi:MAG: phosphoribosylaminoimidazole synthetase, partial [SAR324 cluster bacterium]|nr:phosphoribosylaminoimidazole synthetase [SAR324 cluster bacterium]